MSTRPRGKGLRHVSDIITDVLEELPEPKPMPHRWNRHCGCEDCMRMYLRSVEKKGDAA